MGDLSTIERNAEPIARPVMGRPTLYTQQIGEGICQSIANGMTKRGACGLAEVAETTFEEWCKRDDFSGMLARAEAKAELIFTESMRRGAEGDPEFKGDWKAGESWLKRRRRADYGDTLDIRKVDTAQLLEALQLAAQSQTEPLPEEELLQLEAGLDAL